VSQSPSHVANGGGQDGAAIRFIGLGAAPQLTTKEFWFGLENFYDAAGEGLGGHGTTLVQFSIVRAQNGVTREGEVVENRQDEGGVLLAAVDRPEQRESWMRLGQCVTECGVGGESIAIFGRQDVAIATGQLLFIEGRTPVEEIESHG
jgi:hypothetical protein